MSLSFSRLSVLILLVFLLVTPFCTGQPQKAKWNNKDKGTSIIDFSHIGFYPKDTSVSGISNKKLIGISVRFYELAFDGCKLVEGKVKINDKEYKIYDSTRILNSEGEKDSGHYFGIWASEGDYILKASVNNDYYPVKTEKYFLTSGTNYQFTFYLVRKGSVRKKVK